MRSLPPVVPGAATAVALCTVLALSAPAAHADGKPGNDGFTIEDPRITESSGLVASRAHPGVYWTHNDQDKGAFLYAVDSRTGKTVATITMTGVGTPRDVEAISMGPDGNLYVGDIGDNFHGKWSFVWVYKLPEPKELKDQRIRATQYVVKYSDGPRDAEALMVHPKTGRIYIADKQEDGGHLYEGPPIAQMSTSKPNIFKRGAATDLWVTDGAFSPNGKQLALRGYFGGVSYLWQGGGKIEREGRLSVPLQRQGESVAYSPDGTRLMYGTEGEASDVEPVEVKGAGRPAGASDDGGGDSDGENDGISGNYKKGILVAGVALLAVIGLKRVFRRSGG
ncbi:WD40 repeat domain-containing protein [Streptomyces sp. p1417]|uniref:WD40 repeat domain-containing protein n=1 Tax=Streptomyces typhae TaxID=2681492 RepID=A0A6L6WVL1_9ACTN|nr:WD40 repeat domain-containing protein [Streptomyces typhae]MVO86133.1 WD40 repeat domain-containing protein [Streptomyces typhae]